MSTTGNRDLSDLRDEVESTRRELGDTVEALAAKADVKSRLSDAWAERKVRLRAGLDRAQRSPAVVAAVVAGVTAAVALLVRRLTGRRGR